MFNGKNTFSSLWQDSDIAQSSNKEQRTNNASLTHATGRVDMGKDSISYKTFSTSFREIRADQSWGQFINSKDLQFWQDDLLLDEIKGHTLICGQDQSVISSILGSLNNSFYLQPSTLTAAMSSVGVLHIWHQPSVLQVIFQLRIKNIFKNFAERGIQDNRSPIASFLQWSLFWQQANSSMFESIKQLDKILLLITCLIAGDRTFENFFNTCVEFPSHPRPVFFKPWMMDFAVFVPTDLKPNDGTPSIISLLDPVLIKSRNFYSFSESITCLHLLM